MHDIFTEGEKKNIVRAAGAIFYLFYYRSLAHQNNYWAYLTRLGAAKSKSFVIFLRRLARGVEVFFFSAKGCCARSIHKKHNIINLKGWLIYSWSKIAKSMAYFLEHNFFTYVQLRSFSIYCNFVSDKSVAFLAQGWLTLTLGQVAKVS